ncbi:MAG: hypothetical protein MUP76_11365, partial [Acidimicrobiia bacterium]|nr:hypothetical protein [Acidimicrobiia bacterium]
MATTTPRVRDFTTAERLLHVEVASGDAFEMLLSLYALGGDEDEADLAIGSEWFEGIRSRAGEDLLARLRLFGDWSVWIALISEVHAMGAPYTSERLLEHLAQMDPVALRRGLLEVGSCHASEPIPSDDLEAMAEGDLDVISRAGAWCDKCPGLMELLKLPADSTRDTLVGLLGSFWEADPVPAGTVGIME